MRLDGVLVAPDRKPRIDAASPRRDAAPVIISEIEWQRRKRQNVGAAVEAAGGRIYGPGGAAELLGIKPTTLISRLRTLGLRDGRKRQRAVARRALSGALTGSSSKK